MEKDMEEFLEMIRKAREEFDKNSDFQAEEWEWVHELDNEGFFIFCYLVEDFNQDILTRENFEETVYTLVMLRHKLLPMETQHRMGIPIRWQLQLLFNLYEKLKHEEMSWEACQNFLDAQIKTLPSLQGN